MKKIKKILFSVLVVIGLLVGIGLIGISFASYQPTSSVETLYQKSQHNETSGWIHFPVRGEKKGTFIFYQGALVEEVSYAGLAQDLAERGVEVYLIKSFLNLPILNRGAANRILSQERIDQAYIGGHSLGGVVATMELSKDHPSLAGLVLLASYPASNTDLHRLEVPVLSITADQDQVLKWEAYQTAKKRLPASTDYQTITGGNHSGFGAYGQQRGDGKARISGKEQVKQVADLIESFIEKHSGRRE